MKLDSGGCIGVHGTDVLQWWNGTADEAQQCALADLLPRQQLLYFSCVDQMSSNFFCTSNEHDWRGVVLDQPKITGVDAVVSFANNIGWDQVIENGAKYLILCDYQATPLVIQQHIFRPLLLVSATPAEFYSRLFGDPRWMGICEAQENYLQVLLAIDKDLGAWKCDRDHCAEKAALFQQETLQLVESRLKADTKLLKEYYAAILRVRSGKSAQWPFVVYQRRVGTQLPVTDQRRDIAFEFCSDLLLRYAKAKRASCMSSQTNFAYLQGIMKDGLFFVKGNLQETDLWGRLALLLQSGIGSLDHGATAVTLHLSNVPDYILYSASRQGKRPALGYTPLVEIVDSRAANALSGKDFASRILAALKNIKVRFAYFTCGGMRNPHHTYHLMNQDNGSMELR